MKKFWTPIKIAIIILFVIVAAAGPFVINEAYRKNDGYITIWGAEEVFGFWGEVVGAGATILALIYTIMYTEFQRICDRKSACKPHLSTTWNNLEIKDIKEKELKYDYCIVLGEGVEIYATTEIPVIIKRIKKGISIDKEKTPTTEVYCEIKQDGFNAEMECRKNHLFIEYYVKNVGIGTAIDISLFIGEVVVIPPSSLIASECTGLLLDCNMEKLRKEKQSEIKLTLKYHNVYEDCLYIQEETLLVCRDEKEYLRVLQRFEQKLTSPIEK